MVRHLSAILAIIGLLPLQAEELISVSGQIILKNENLLILKGTSDVYHVNFDATLASRCSEGDLAVIRGLPHFNDWLNKNYLTASNITTFGHSPLPATIDIDGAQIADERLLHEFVRLGGTIAAVNPGSAGWSWVCLRTPTGDVGLTIRERSYPRVYLRSLLDAEVSVRGIVIRSWGSSQQLAPHVSLRGEESLRVTKAPPEDPFGAPPFAHVGDVHRCRISGTVLAAGANRCMLLPDAGEPVQILAETNTVWPEIGHRATAVGFAETDPVRLRFTESLIRDDRPADSVPTEEPATDLDLIYKGVFHGHAVRIDATVCGIDVKSASHAARLFLQTEGNRSLSVEFPARFPLARLPVRSSVIRVSGICIFEYENASAQEAFPRFRGITILPRTPDDIVVLRGPPWLTPLRAALIVALIIGLFVFREIMLRSSARLKLKERTSLAIELHDSLAQFLTGISLQLDAAQFAEQAGIKEKANHHILCAHRALKSCRENLRYYLGDLRRESPMTARLSETIRRAVLPHVGTVKLLIRFAVPQRRFSDSTLHAIVCIVRELSVNAVRHGGATRIMVAGECKDGVIRFSVRDNGTGFDPKACPGSADGHFGLLGIRERLNDLHGTLTIDSRPGKGTKARITLTI